MSFGAKLRNARKEKHMTQIELAEYLGIDNVTVSCYERNTTFPSLQIFKMLCDLFSLDANDLLKSIN